MTENEAKSFIQGKLDCMKKCDVFDCKNTDECDSCNYCYAQGNFGEQKRAFDMAIQALEEIQQYRAIGLTPQMVKDLIASEKKAHKIALENADKLDEYQSIGTPDECRTAVERMKPKKIIAKKKTRSYLGTDYYCPICNKRQLTAYILSKGDDFCKDCGQAIDWSE